MLLTWNHQVNVTMGCHATLITGNWFAPGSSYVCTSVAHRLVKLIMCGDRDLDVWCVHMRTCMCVCKSAAYQLPYTSTSCNFTRCFRFFASNTDKLVEAWGPCHCTTWLRTLGGKELIVVCMVWHLGVILNVTTPKSIACDQCSMPPHGHIHLLVPCE